VLEKHGVHRNLGVKGDDAPKEKTNGEGKHVVHHAATPKTPPAAKA
jgi:hypothetical protein